MTSPSHIDPSGWTTRLSEQDVARHTQSGAWRNVTLADCVRLQAERGAQAALRHSQAMFLGQRDDRLQPALFLFLVILGDVGQAVRQERIVEALAHLRRIRPGL
jgi:hypothetical protein